jgi:hypothetical protein
VADDDRWRVWFAMRSCAPLLLLATSCFVAQRPPPPPPPAPRFSVAAEKQRDPEMCRRMAEWDCADLDCPDCAAVARTARGRDVGEVLGAVGALVLAGAIGRQADAPARRTMPFADDLHTGAEPGAGNGWLPATRAESTVEACRQTCRRCAATKLRCR